MFDTNINYVKNISWILIHMLFKYVLLSIALISNDM
jgi:hypothetical protein